MTNCELQEKYLKKTPNSFDYYKRSSKIFPGGISHNIRFFSPYPFFTKKAKSKYIYDVDNNRFTDYWMGHWALILGHSSKEITEKLSKQIHNGTLYGTCNDVSVELGETIKDLVPIAESLRFCTTGSEATMYATRIARAISRKRIIVKTIGGWHGFNTDLMQSVNFPFDIDEGLGMTGSEGDFVESIPFNDLDHSIKLLDIVKDDVACVIVEPLLGGGGCIPADPNYLKGLDEFCKKNGIILILDEIVTGFRFGIGSLSDQYNIEPDLITLGKIVGGGLPIGVVCGREEIMKVVDPLINKSKEKRCYIGGGTFSSNPITMTAGLSTLRYLKKHQKKIYPKINSLGDKTRRGLKKIFGDFGINVDVTGKGSLFLVHFLNGKVDKINNSLDVALTNDGRLVEYHFALMTEHEIFFLPTKMGAFSTEHSIHDVSNLLDSTKRVIESGILCSKNV